MTTPQQPDAPARKPYRLRSSGCCDAPRTVYLTEAEAADGQAKGLLTPLPAASQPAPPPQLPRTFQP